MGEQHKQYCTEPSEHTIGHWIGMIMISDNGIKYSYRWEYARFWSNWSGPLSNSISKQKHLFSITKATLQSPMSIHLSVNKTPKYPLSFILRRSFFVYNPSSFINFETFNFFSLFLNFEVCFACVKVSCVFISVPMSWGWWLLTVVACC